MANNTEKTTLRERGFFGFITPPPIPPFGEKGVGVNLRLAYTPIQPLGNMVYRFVDYDCFFAMSCFFCIFSASIRSGLARKIDEYVPTAKPTAKMSAKSRVVAGPKI